MQILGSRRSLLLLLAVCPGFWWGLLYSSNFLQEVNKSPLFLKGKIGSIYSDERTGKVRLTRDANTSLGLPGRLVGGIFFNNFTIVIDEFFDLTTFLNPRFYFQAGDGSPLSPPKTELIPSVLFPAWIFGLITFIKNRNYKLIKVLIIIVFIPYILGQKNIVFLWPVMIFYVIICREGILAIKSMRLRNSYARSVIIYGVLIVARSFYLLIG